jgi:LysR family transcriptional regulator, regulator of the ytmI operon
VGRLRQEAALPIAPLLPPGHRLSAAHDVEVADLRNERLLLAEVGCAYRELVERSLGERGAMLRMGIEISSMASLVHAVAAGLVPAIVPRALVDPLPQGATLCDVRGIDLGLTIGLVRRAERAAPNRVLDAFIEELRGALVRCS